MQTRVQHVLIHNAKILSRKTFDATFGNPNRSFFAYSDNILTLFIRTILNSVWMITLNHLYSLLNANFRFPNFNLKQIKNYLKYKLYNI